MEDSFDADGVETKTSDDIEPESVSSSDITSGLSIPQMAVTVFIGFDSEFCFISNKVFLITGANVFLRPAFAFPIKVLNSPDVNRLSTSVCFGAGPWEMAGVRTISLLSFNLVSGTSSLESKTKTRKAIIYL